MKIAIIGGGLTGLASAALLSRAGHQVDLYEKNTQPGGRARVLKGDGWQIDMGPSWYMMPEVFERYFGLFDQSVSDFYQLHRLEPAYRIDNHDGTRVDVSTDFQSVRDFFESREAGGGAQLERYMARAKAQYEIASEHFLYRTYDHLTDLLDWNLIKRLPMLQIHESLERHINRCFKDPLLRRMMSFHSVFLGGSPGNLPALYALMNEADFGRGIWYPEGGFGALVDGLVRLAETHGTKLHLGQPVEQVLLSGRTIQGLQVGGQKLDYDRVLNTADAAHLDLALLPAQARMHGASHWHTRQIAPSCLLIYLVVNRRLDNLEHHHFYFSESWQANLDSLFKRPSWPTDPTFYINCPTRTDRGIVGEGQESVMLLVPVSAGLDQAQAGATVEATLKRFWAIAGEEHAAQVSYQQVYGPADFQVDYNALEGTAFGLAHTLFQSAAFRVPMRHPKVEGLFSAGQYTHPGVGVPTALIAAEVVSGLIEAKA